MRAVIPEKKSLSASHTLNIVQVSSVNKFLMLTGQEVLTKISLAVPKTIQMSA